MALQLYSKRQFEYNASNAGNKSSAHFAMPLEFLKTVYKTIRNPGYDYDILCNLYALSADQAVNSSLGGKDVVNYEFVTERTLGKGKKVYQFGVADYNLNISNLGGFSPYQFINKNLLHETSYEEGNTNPLKETFYNYSPVYFKNALSANYTSNNLSQVIPSNSMGIYLVYKFGAPYYTSVLLNGYPIESGKYLLNETITKDYFNGNTITTKINNEYAVNDIQKPVNLTKQSVIHANGIVNDTSYKYAHEKGNQLMIDKNMVGIPLETTTTQTTGGVAKTISKTETIYPASVPTTQTGNLVLPTSVLSYDLQNGNPSTEVTYDKYDAKGNLQQYTTKDGVSTTIIWGYNQTQPIAKITGAKLSDIQQSMIDSIVNASNSDASNPANEPALITALDSFRNNSGLAGYQISTYTYDPLIGVTSITPPSGIREVYLYDTANRLKEIREGNQTGKLLKEFKYNYKN
ncbi:hypothetical protein [Chryseobacterium wanjuense]